MTLFSINPTTLLQIASEAGKKGLLNPEDQIRLLDGKFTQEEFFDLMCNIWDSEINEEVEE